MVLPKIIAIVGPTASGKTALGIEIAKMIGGEVISVDSRMVYQGMDIGTAKPVGEWKTGEIEIGGKIDQLFGVRKMFSVEGVPHFGIDLVKPDVTYSAAEFKLYAEKTIKDILKRGHVPILVGGTGMWLSAVIDNLDLSSTSSDETLRAELEAKSLGDLYHAYKQVDPEGAEVIDRLNKRRVLRALEVSILTGKPFSQLQTRGKPKYDVLQIGLSVSREVLSERIDQRVEEMIGLGLVNEVRRLHELYGSGIESMTGIGYRQICAFLENRSSLKEAMEEIKKDTRAYAKRQMTWFKRDPRIQWLENADEAKKQVEIFLR